MNGTDASTMLSGPPAKPVNTILLDSTKCELSSGVASRLRGMAPEAPNTHMSTEAGDDSEAQGVFDRQKPFVHAF